MAELRGPAPPEVVYGYPPQIRMILPRTQMMRVPRVPPRWYQPGPQPEGTVRLVLYAPAYEEPGSFREYKPGEDVLSEHVFDVPIAQHERWKAAAEAFWAAQDEIEAVIGAR